MGQGDERGMFECEVECERGVLGGRDEKGRWNAVRCTLSLMHEMRCSVGPVHSIRIVNARVHPYDSGTPQIATIYLSSP